MPPHAGHRYLIDFASSFCPELTVVVGSLKSEPIPGELRFGWMKGLYPFLNVVHLTDENPQFPHEHPDFWNIWKNSLERVAPKPIDYLFASEEYGRELAGVLNAEFIPCNGMRTMVSVSGTKIRQNPRRHWDDIPELVRPYFSRKILIFGPESTGKTTLCGRLAKEFGGVSVPEYARTWLKGREDKFDLCDMKVIARGQYASEQAAIRLGKPFVFCDTDALTTAIWCEELFGSVPSSVERLTAESTYDLTLLLDVDVPWIDDTLRLQPEDRDGFLEKCKLRLDEAGRDYSLISGDWHERWKTAVEVVRERFFRDRS